MARSCLVATIVAVLTCTGLAPAGSWQSTFTGPSFAITRVTVIDVRTGERRPDQTLVISDNRITRVGPTAAMRLPGGTREVDAKGAYAI